MNDKLSATVAVVMLATIASLSVHECRKASTKPLRRQELFPAITPQEKAADVRHYHEKLRREGVTDPSTTQPATPADVQRRRAGAC